MSEADVVIVGSGATGSLLAARLGRPWRKVRVLEGGPQRDLAQLVSSTLWSRRLKWSGPPVRVGGANPVTFPFEAGWGTGGSALHHYACWFRLHPEDFRVASLYGTGLDWRLPMAINSVAYKGRPACIQDGWCDAGCPTVGNESAISAGK